MVDELDQPILPSEAAVVASRAVEFFLPDLASHVASRIADVLPPGDRDMLPEPVWENSTITFDERPGAAEEAIKSLVSHISRQGWRRFMEPEQCGRKGVEHYSIGVSGPVRVKVMEAWYPKPGRKLYSIDVTGSK